MLLHQLGHPIGEDPHSRQAGALPCLTGIGVSCLYGPQFEIGLAAKLPGRVDS